MNNQFDFIIIGSGVAGMALANGLKSAGKSVAIVEEDLWGGTCPNRGCDPKKVLLAAVEARDAVAQLKGKGFSETPEISWPDLMRFKKTFTDPVPESELSGFKESGITAIKGRAEFIDAGHIQVDNQTYGAKQFVLANGQYPTIPDIEGKEFFKTSNDFLSLETLPEKIVFVGAGYIAFELAGIANACGAEVHIIHHNEKPLKQFDEEFVGLLVKQLQNSGIVFHFNESVDAVKQTDSGYALTLKSGKALEAGIVFSTMGRAPNIKSLQLEKAGVTYSKKGIAIDEYLRTSCQTIYACGDCLDKQVPRLTPISSFEGGYLVGLLSDKKQQPISYPATPTVVFTNYRLAQVGVDTETAQANPDKYDVKSFDMTDWLNYKRRNEAVAKAKIIVEKDSGLLAGATVISQEADELVNFFTLIINEKIASEKIGAMITLFPTIGNDLSSLY